MATKVVSAGIVVYRHRGRTTEILLVHPGGPFWANKDEHAWSIPKGEIDPDEDPQAAARREFTEELGHPVPPGDLTDLGSFRAGSKTIRAWLVEGDLDETMISSNTFEMAWPPGSEHTATFPEVDRAAWFDLADAPAKLHKGQRPLVDLIETALGVERPDR